MSEAANGAASIAPDDPAYPGVMRASNDEAALVREARTGSRSAAEELVRRHWGGAYRTAFLIVRDRAASEDVTQEAILAAIGGLKRFRDSRPFAPWLHRITVNRAIDWTRAQARRREVELGGGNESAAGQPVESQLPPALSESLDSLDAVDRAIVVLRHLWDYKASEIGQMLELSPSTVRTRLQRALGVLRSALEEETTP